MNKSFYLKLKLLLVGLCFFSITIYSQNFDTQLNLEDSTQTHIILLKNGKRIKGRILEIQNEKVFFLKKKEDKKIALTLSEIQEIKVKGNLDWNNKKYAKPFQYSQYLFYTNTGFSLKQGEKNYRTFMGASILWDRGLTDGVSIGFCYSFPLTLGANIKLSTPSHVQNGTAFKSLILTIPFLLAEEEKFFILENSLSQSFGSPDRFFNISISNYYIKNQDEFFSSDTYFPIIYNSISLGGGIRMSERWQLIIENNVNFNNKFVEANLIPSFGFSYATSKFNIAFGFHSHNKLGFNIIPILEFNIDDAIVFTPEAFSRLPYFTFSKIF